MPSVPGTLHAIATLGLLALLAAGCDDRPARPGKIVMPPFGHIDLCQRQPEHFACRP